MNWFRPLTLFLILFATYLSFKIKLNDRIKKHAFTSSKPKFTELCELYNKEDWPSIEDNLDKIYESYILQSNSPNSNLRVIVGDTLDNFSQFIYEIIVFGEKNIDKHRQQVVNLNNLHKCSNISLDFISNFNSRSRYFTIEQSNVIHTSFDRLESIVNEISIDKINILRLYIKYECILNNYKRLIGQFINALSMYKELYQNIIKSTDMIIDDEFRKNIENDLNDTLIEIFRLELLIQTIKISENPRTLAFINCVK